MQRQFGQPQNNSNFSNPQFSSRHREPTPAPVELQYGGLRGGFAAEIVRWGARGQDFAAISGSGATGDGAVSLGTDLVICYIMLDNIAVDLLKYHQICHISTLYTCYLRGPDSTIYLEGQSS